MSKLQEKRNLIRYLCEGPLTLMHTQRGSRPIEARLLNFSKQGLGFSSHHPLTPGTTIIVRASGENYRHISPNAACQPPTMCFAMIKWCLEGRKTDKLSYRMGAVYLMPY